MQPSTYGVDNRCLVDALGQLGSASRGVAVVDTEVQDAELRALTDAGVRAIRVNFVSPQTWGTTTPEILAALAKRVSPFGWHVQILMTGDQIAAHEGAIRALADPGGHRSPRAHSGAGRPPASWLRRGAPLAGRAAGPG